MKATPVIWDGAVDWTQYDALLIRSCWDYHQKLERFELWLAQIIALKIPTFNTAETVQWNLRKRYLLDLERAGVHIVPTRVIEPQASAPRLKELIADLGGRDTVMKPEVSAGGNNTFLVRERQTVEETQASQRSFEQILQKGPVLLQPYLSDVIEKGERSFIFIYGNFSHCVLRHPPSGDFRAQPTLGGSVERVIPNLTEITFAGAALAAANYQPLYARVDVLKQGKELFLSELELIEPRLFFAEEPLAAAALAAGLARRL